MSLADCLQAGVMISGVPVLAALAGWVQRGRVADADAWSWLLLMVARLAAWIAEAV